MGSIYCVYDTDTGEELAYHAENGPTLARWMLKCSKRGRRKVAVKEIDQDDAKPEGQGEGNDG